MALRESQLQVAFALALLSGVAAIIVGWHYSSFYLTIFFPVAAMLGYLGWALVSDKAVVKTPSFADSLYFLGFLLTLVALAVSLYDFAEDDGTGGMEGTIYRFGCALITTIVGLTCRILLINFQKEVSDNLKEVEVSFSDSVK